jgi:hypothetical protein
MTPDEITINAQRCCKITHNFTGQENQRPDNKAAQYWRNLFERSILYPADWTVEYDEEVAKVVQGEFLWKEHELRSQSVPNLRKIARKLDTTGAGKDELILNIIKAQNQLK